MLTRLNVLAAAGLLLGLAGCASTAEITAKDQATCTARGAGPDTVAYQRCMLILSEIRQEERAARSARLMAAGAAMQNAGAAIRTSTPTAYQSAPVTEGMGGVCFATGSYASGLNRVCNYNCTGSAAAITLASTSICPLKINR